MLTILLLLFAVLAAALSYLRLEPRGPRAWIPLACRSVAWGGMAALLLNPGCAGPPAAESRVVLLDASLSMRADSAAWRHAEDTARSLGRVRWFGDERPWTDSLAPRGRSDPAAALASAAAVGRRVVLVTDGELDDLTEVPAGLLGAAEVLALPRAEARDFAITGVSAPGRVTAGDSLVVVAEAGLSGPGSGDSATVSLALGARTLAQRRLFLRPAEGATIRLVAPTRGLPAGAQFFTLRVTGAGDQEPRDDTRLVAVAVTRTPGIVVVATPGDWDARFLYRTLRQVADLPVKGYVSLQAGHWRDMDGLREVSADAMRSAVRGADVVAYLGDPPGSDLATSARGVLRWPSGRGGAGEWYVDAVPASPVALAFLGIPPDSLPPVALGGGVEGGAGDWLGLTARQGRRGAARPAWIGRQVGSRREIIVGAEGFWRWVFRGGASADAYRALVAGSMSWLLGAAESGQAAARPSRAVVEQGMPLIFERAADTLAALPIELLGADPPIQDTLRFGGDGRAMLWVPPGTYRYRLSGGAAGAGAVAVDRWSREWIRRPAVVTSRPGAGLADATGRTARDLPWLYLLVIVALGGEWLGRRRLGLR